MKKILLIVAAVLALSGVVWRYGDLLPGSGMISNNRAGAMVLYGNVDIREVDLAFRVPGRIAVLHAEEGDSIEAGALLAELDRRPYRDAKALAEANLATAVAMLSKLEEGSRPEEIAQAEALVEERGAALSLARKIYERRRELARQKTISVEALDEALTVRTEAIARLAHARAALELARKGPREEDIAIAAAQMDAAQAQLDAAETALADTRIHAPNSGTIITRAREPGSIVQAGSAVYTLSLDRPVWVRAYVSETELGRIHPGQAVEVYSDSRPDTPYSGRIGFISPVAEFTPKSVETEDLRTDLVYRLRIVIQEGAAEGLRQGMPVTVRVPENQPG